MARDGARALDEAYTDANSVFVTINYAPDLKAAFDGIDKIYVERHTVINPKEGPTTIGVINVDKQGSTLFVEAFNSAGNKILDVETRFQSEDPEIGEAHSKVLKALRPLNAQTSDYSGKFQSTKRLSELNHSL